MLHNVFVCGSLCIDLYVMMNVGNEFFKQGQWQNAINAWTQASKIDTSNKIFNSKLYCNCASAYSKLDKHSTAVEECSRAIQADRQYTKAYIRRGDAQVALATKESMAEAIRDYERAYELTCKSNDEDSPDAKGLKNKIKQTKIAMKRVGKKDLYGTLGVGPRATDEEIRKAYKKKALQCHPDKNASKSEAEKQKAEIMFKGVGEAYGILSDPEKKREYDLGADVDEIENGQGLYLLIGCLLSCCDMAIFCFLGCVYTLFHCIAVYIYT